MKKSLIWSFTLVLALLTPLVIGNTAVAVGVEQLLVFDNFEEDGSISKKFRSIPKISSSANGQFSAAELPKLLTKIPVARDHVWIIDLRQESHGFINGIPITWYSNQNRGNVDKTPDQIAKDEVELLKGISKENSVKIYTLKKLAAGKFKGEHPVLVIPHQVESEQQLVTKLGANYQRFYVLDHNRPTDQEADRYLNFVKNQLKPGDWQHFHCRGGKGRSSTFMAMYDMILNAHSMGFAEIMQHQFEMGNIKLDSPQTKAEKLWKAGFSKDRYDFLQQFYSYVIDPNGYAARSWSDWLKLHTPK